MAGPKVPGIDVSKYQGRIDWPAVATSPVRFVIDARDTREPISGRAVRAEPRGRHRERAGRRRLSLRQAQPLPAGTLGAKPIISCAWPTWPAGDVLPVLDIEETGGLSPRQLRAWARAWLDRVESRTGVRAMVYSGNYFWRGFMRNSSWFGRRGHPLWVAHWNVGAPDVPGGRWAGQRIHGLAVVGHRQDRRHPGATSTATG